MHDLCDFDEQLPARSADGEDCHEQWESVTIAAQAAVCRIPYDLWLLGSAEGQRPVQQGFSTAHMVFRWQPRHFRHIGVHGQHDVYLSVSGALCTLTENHCVDQYLTANDLVMADIEKLRKDLEAYLRPSRGHEALYVAIEQELTRVMRHPRPASLGVGHRCAVTVDIPLPQDRCMRLRKPNGSYRFSQYLYVWQLPYADYFVDDRGRLIGYSAEHHRLAVVHLRSIVRHDDLYVLLTGLKRIA